MKIVLINFLILIKSYINKFLFLIFKTPFKKEFFNKHTNNIFFITAPISKIFISFLVFLFIPFSEKALFADIKAGVFLIFIILNLDVFGCLMAGIGADSINSIIGSLRATRQIINAKLVSFASIIPIIMTSHSLQFIKIVEAQEKVWFIFPHIIIFICFIFSTLAFMMIKPFNLSNSSSEISGGYKSEYSGLLLFLFKLGDFLILMAISSFAVIMFFGGWLVPDYPILKYIPPILWFFIKMLLCLSIMFFIKNQMPRFREDQLRALLWKLIFPISLFWSFATAAFIVFNN